MAEGRTGMVGGGGATGDRATGGASRLRPSGRVGGADRVLVAVSAGLRRPSSTALLATRLAEATVSALRTHGLATAVEFIELRVHATAIAEALVSGTRTAALDAALTAITGADGLIAVTPTFAASYAGLFKSFFDALGPDDLIGMPVLLGATGGSARHSLVIEYAMRPLLNYFRTRIVPTGVFAAGEDFGGSDGTQIPDRLAARIERAAAELAALVAGDRAADGAPFTVAPSFTDRTRLVAHR